jgi:hypothetical protein
MKKARIKNGLQLFLQIKLKRHDKYTKPIDLLAKKNRRH